MQLITKESKETVRAKFRFADRQYHPNSRSSPTGSPNGSPTSSSTWVFEQVNTPKNFERNTRIKSLKKKCIVQRNVGNGYASHWLLKSGNPATTVIGDLIPDQNESGLIVLNKTTCNCGQNPHQENKIHSTNHTDNNLYRCMFQVLMGNQECERIEKRYLGSRRPSKRISIPIAELLN